MTIRALVVDDEAAARERIRRLLADEKGIDLIAERDNGPEALRAIRELEPDLVFLDVQMPGFDGFRVLSGIDPARMPAIVFVTAYDQYAVRAFDAHAVDYLLKPFDRARFGTALSRARAALGEGDEATGLLALRDHVSREGAPARPGDAYPERLIIKDAGRIYFVRVADVDWVEGARNYVRLHAGKDRHILRRTLRGVGDLLDPRQFVRIHRSTIVNVARIREMQPWFSGDYLVILHSGERLKMSRNHRELLETNPSWGGATRIGTGP